MSIAILTVSSLSLICSAGTLYFMARTAKQVSDAKVDVDKKIEEVQTKVAHNARVVKRAFNELEV